MSQSENKKTIIYLMGPTAAGKTSLAIKLTQAFPFEIISVDSGMVYRSMDIGTAKPTPAEQLLAPHRLIDIRDPAETYSAAQFRLDALNAIEDILQHKKIPLLIGGTMLYFKVLQEGISPLPNANPDIRARLMKEAAEHKDGWQALHTRLKQVDPDTAMRLAPNDKQRIQRALEVYEITGIPMSKLYLANPPTALPYNVIKLAIAPAMSPAQIAHHPTLQREILRKNIEHRLQIMLRQGLITEVEQLFKRGDLHADLPSIRAVGYRQVWQYLNGEVDYETMQQNIITATCQLAKRQLTWLRSWKDKDIIWLDSNSADIDISCYSQLQKELQMQQHGKKNY